MSEGSVVRGLDEAARDRMHRRFAAARITGLWEIKDSILPSTPTPAARPWAWRWTAVRALAFEAARLVPVDRGGDRRVLGLINPGAAHDFGATATLWAGIQVLNPGEVAPAHRHSPNALRFVIEGRSAYTTVNHDRCDMAPGDLVLTPGGTWHDHFNEGEAPVLWLDGLDLPLVRTLAATFFEPYPNSSQDYGTSVGSSARRHGFAGLAPVTHPADHGGSPLFIYPWSTTVDALEQLAGDDPDPFDAHTLAYVDPTTGGPILPTIDAQVTRLPQGFATRARREVASRVYCVVEGCGRSVVDGIAFDWERGDVLVAPSWAATEHRAVGGAATLFSYSDAPVLRALGLWRREPIAEAHQEIVGTFSPDAAGEM